MKSWTAPDATRSSDRALLPFALAGGCAFFAAVMLVDALFYASGQDASGVLGFLLAAGLLMIGAVAFAGWGFRAQDTSKRVARTPLVHHDPTGSGTSAQTLSHHPLLVYGQVEHRSFMLSVTNGATQVRLANPWNPTMTRDGYLEPESGVVIYEGKQHFSDPVQAAHFAAETAHRALGAVKV